MVRWYYLYIDYSIFLFTSTKYLYFPYLLYQFILYLSRGIFPTDASVRVDCAEQAYRGVDFEAGSVGWKTAASRGQFIR